VRTADTSVVVAAFASWHEAHRPARQALDDGVSLIGHCALEAYSVLTRLPSPHKVAGHVVREFLEARFPGPFLQLAPVAHRNFIRELSEKELSGGAVYDALVAATAADAGAELVTCDKRALPVYERYRVQVKVITAKYADNR
jgi:predicted nucleic acid-binding protein